MSTRTSSAQPNKWKKQGMNFAINHGGVDYFPDYRLDSAGGLPPIKVMAKIIGIFKGHRNSILDSHGQQLFEGNRPQNLLASAPERVAEAAMDEVQELAHS
ncbi:hypothetical protein [Methylomonas koyamae]|uniref:hypothetical protein n=1 Tax=Methylomonas koyamae TaxID=702114 RepID=UPI001C91F38C|nr:hypothetical protein [Methylomonas koyamae]